MHSSHIRLQRLQAIQAIQYISVLTATGYKDYKPNTSNGVATQYSSILCMHVIQRLQVKWHNIFLHVLMQVIRITIQANCKQHNILCMQVTRITSQLQATQCIVHADYKGYKPIANNTICDLILEKRPNCHIWYFEKYQFHILKPLWFSCARLIVTTLDSYTV